ncbi:protein of unknown function [Azospirillum baldaniorum]|uniref:Uncharacterized protein n=1 Tax=Azospirillum baldaniorum TaxID=1064539 RepID=A0A9P1JR58_9PROT|nr:protein of unknown function [Azospirillum baldaniorum]
MIQRKSPSGTTSEMRMAGAHPKF